MNINNTATTRNPDYKNDPKLSDEQNRAAQEKANKTGTDAEKNRPVNR